MKETWYQCADMIGSGIFDFSWEVVEKVNFWLFSVFFGKNQKFHFLSYLPTDVSFHLSHQPAWSDEYGVRSLKSCKKSFEKKNFVFLGNPLYRDKIFEFFFYQWIAFIHTKTLIPHWSSLDMCVRHSSALKSKSVKI